MTEIGILLSCLGHKLECKGSQKWVGINLPKLNLPTHNLPTQFADDNLLTHDLPKPDDSANRTKKSQFADSEQQPASRPRESLGARYLLQTFARPFTSVLLVIARRWNNVSIVKTTFRQIVIWQIVI